MTIAGIILAAALAQSGISEPIVAIPGNAGPMRLHIGDTGIRCVRLPCPAKGLFVPDDGKGDVRQQLLYSDMDGRSPPPPMLADKTAEAMIVKAWEDGACLAIDGRLISGEDDKPILRVDRIVGPCGKARE